MHEKSKLKFIVSVTDTCTSQQRTKFYFFFKVPPREYYRLESHLDDIMTPIPALMRSLCLDKQEEEEYLPNRGLAVLNQHIERLSGGRISPVRFQLTQPIQDVARSTRSYIGHKSKEVVQTTLECIALGQSNELAFVANARSMEPGPVNKIMATLLSLYEGATSWYTKMTILSFFAQQYTKTQLKDLGLGFLRSDKEVKTRFLLYPKHKSTSCIIAEG